MNTPDFNKAFRALQRMGIGSLMLLALTNAGWAWAYFTSQRTGQERIYVASDGGTISAVLAKGYRPTVYEARNHIRHFATLLHAHDASTYAERLNAALKLIDKKAGSRLYNRMKKGGILEHYTRFNSRTELEIDSVVVNMSTEPYRGSVYTRQRYLYDNQSETIPIAADFELMRTHRSDANPFGLLIINWDYKNYQPQAK
jgi:hypothetical protein